MHSDEIRKEIERKKTGFREKGLFSANLNKRTRQELELSIEAILAYLDDNLPAK